ncbi:MAG TPA: hypothetical protein DIT13_10010, partial [Verrucomicrobiales bacterium]|nr:hypothetical protein [Verrucomicrobiales bacterium]
PHPVSHSKPTEPKKKKSLLGHLKAGLKKIIGLGKKKTSAAEPKHADGRHPAKMHPHARPPREDHTDGDSRP